MLCGDEKYTKTGNTNTLMYMFLEGLASFADTGCLMHCSRRYFSMNRIHYGKKKKVLFLLSSFL